MTSEEANKLGQEALDANPLYTGQTVYVTGVRDAGDEFAISFDGPDLYDPLELFIRKVSGKPRWAVGPFRDVDPDSI